MNEVDETLKRIAGHRSVEGYLIATKNYEIVRSSYTGERKAEGDRILSALPDLVSIARTSIKNINPTVFLKE